MLKDEELGVDLRSGDETPMTFGVDYDGTTSVT
jgi:hypothetical protein